MPHTRQEFLAIFGNVTMQFSSMEFLVGEILCTLIYQKNAVIGGLLINDVSLARRITHIRDLAKIRFCQNETMYNRIIALMIDIDRIRIDRNQFIHGIWQIHDHLLSQGYIECVNPRWRTLPMEGLMANKRWCRMETTQWTFDKLATLSEEVFAVTRELIMLVEDVRSADVVEPPAD